MNDKNLARFLLTIFLGWLGSFIINHSSLKPEGHTSRTSAYFVLSIFTFGLYPLVAAFCNLTFDPAKPSNIGYIRTAPYTAEPEVEIPSDDPVDYTPAPSAMQIVEDLVVSEPAPVVEETPAYDEGLSVDDSKTVEENGEV